MMIGITKDRKCVGMSVLINRVIRTNCICGSKRLSFLWNVIGSVLTV